MKKTIIITIFTALLTMTTMLSSCSTGNLKITDILNKNYNKSSHVYTRADELVNVSGNEFVNSNGYLAVFKKQTVTRAEYTVISLSDGSIVDIFNQANTSYSFSFYDKALVVTSTPSDNSSTDDAKYTLYDGTGRKISTSKYNKTVKTLNNDFIYYNGNIYRVEESGKFVLFTTAPEYVSVDIDAINDHYIYAIDSSSVVVYDLHFNYVSCYEAPGYVERFKSFILNNGDILIQYYKVLDNYTDDYDVLSSGSKYNIETILVSAATGKTKEKNKLNNYIILSTLANYTLYDENDDNNEYTSGFENIVILSPIIDKNIDSSSSAAEIRLMSNSAELGSSIKFLDDMIATLPQKIGNDTYMVETISGYAIMDDNGNVIKRFSDTLNFKGGYFVGNSAIYNIDLDTVYNIKSNGAKLVGYVGDSIILKKELDGNQFEYLLFRDGCTYSVFIEKPNSEKNFMLVNNKAYAIHDTKTGESSFYNSKGSLIFTTDNYAEILGTGNDFFLISEQTFTTIKYYVVK